METFLSHSQGLLNKGTSYPSDAVRVALLVSVSQADVAKAQNARAALHPNFGEQTERGEATDVWAR